MTGRVVVLTKDPVPATVKTRVAASVGPEAAARLHAAFARATVARALESGLPVRVSLRGDLGGPFARGLAALGATLEAQASGDLGDRLTHALRGPGRALALGTDCLVFEPGWLRAALALPAPVAFGPSDDGGYWAVAVEGTGGPSATERIFRGIPWSTPETLAASEVAARAAGLAVARLPQSFDVDDDADLLRLLAHPRCPPAVAALAREARAAAGLDG